MKSANTLLVSLLVSAVAAMPVEQTYSTKKCDKPCAGAVKSNDTFVCSDPRLGPKKLPTVFPLSDITHPYQRFGDLCASEFLTTWTANGSYVYPPQNGFQLDTAGNPIQGNVTLAVGTLVDRFGSEYGSFMSPAEAPYTQRALPPSNLDTSPSAPDYPFNYHVYNVSQPFIVLAGPIAPWFGQPGEGVQYFTYGNVMSLISGGFLVRVPVEDLGRKDGGETGGDDISGIAE